MNLNVLMIDLFIKAYPDPARDKRVECISRARELAAAGGHTFTLMTNSDVQKYFDTPVEDLDFGPSTFMNITDPIRFNKAVSIPNLLYLDTDVYLKYIPEMESGFPYFTETCMDCMIGSNNCCDTIKKILEVGFDQGLQKVFDPNSYEHYMLSSKRLYDSEGNPIKFEEKRYEVPEFHFED